MYFSDITHQIIDMRKDKQISPADWHVYEELIALNLNSHARQYDGFTHRSTSLWEAGKKAIGAVDNPFFDFTNRNDPPVANTRKSLGKIREVKRAL